MYVCALMGMHTHGDQRSTSSVSFSQSLPYSLRVSYSLRQRLSLNIQLIDSARTRSWLAWEPPRPSQALGSQMSAIALGFLHRCQRVKLRSELLVQQLQEPSFQSIRWLSVSVFSVAYKFLPLLPKLLKSSYFSHNGHTLWLNKWPMEMKEYSHFQGSSKRRWQWQGPPQSCH